MDIGLKEEIWRLLMLLMEMIGVNTPSMSVYFWFIISISRPKRNNFMLVIPIDNKRSNTS